MLALYQAAAGTCPGLSWTVLAAVGKVETDHGRNSGVSSAGARGPMQFLPSTWAAVPPVDGDRDGRVDITSAPDSIYTAARYLCQNGAGRPEGLYGALFAYNRADWYVQKVLSLSADYAAPPAAATGGGDGSADGLTPRAAHVRQLVTATWGLTDIGGFATSGHTPGSDHYTGRAVDVMLTPLGPANTALGWQVALHLQANAETLGITYLIWDARIWSAGRAVEGWRPYRHPSGSRNATLLHLDHIHVSVR
jgi:hypothetical protein